MTTRHFMLHAAWALAITLALLLLMKVRLEPETVDLRAQGSAAPLLVWPGETGFHLLACRHVLDEFQTNARALDDEAWSYFGDVDLMWNTWKNYYGIRGTLFDWGHGLRPNALDIEPMGRRLQADIFALKGGALSAARSSNDLQARLRQAQQEWVALRDDLIASQARGLAARAVALRGRIEDLAGRLNRLDSEIADREADFDVIEPRFQAYLAATLVLPPTLRRPEHYKYLYNDSPRLLMRYDFRARYDVAFKRAMMELGGPRGPLLGPIPAPGAIP